MVNSACLRTIFLSGVDGSADSEVSGKYTSSPKPLVMYLVFHQLAKGTKMERVTIKLMSYGLYSNTWLLSFAGGRGENEGVNYPLSPRRSWAVAQLSYPLLWLCWWLWIKVSCVLYWENRSSQEARIQDNVILFLAVDIIYLRVVLAHMSNLKEWWASFKPRQGSWQLQGHSEGFGPGIINMHVMIIFFFWFQP